MTWDEYFAAWQAWTHTHGGRMPPVRDQGRVTPLGRWCNQQRYLHKAGRLDPAKAARLTEAGFFAGAPPPDRAARIVTDLHDLVAEGRRFGTLYADPPWLYDNRATRAAAQDHYDGMTLDALAALPVGDLAADDAHLHLWITSPLLLRAQRLFDAWGFEYVSGLVWEKDQMGMGNYWRINHELLLLGVRGQVRSFRVKNLRSVVRFPRRRHSAKPEQIRQMIEAASPGPYLELFGRRTAPGWTVFGNQVQTDLFDTDTITVPAPPRQPEAAPVQTLLAETWPTQATGG
jgi:N6-adenosine-specific RNA methylase IME4